MNDLEKNMIDILIDLKNSYHAIGIKAEFEAEGTRLEEALRLKDIVSKAGLDLTIKIGGCEAIKDMYEAKTIGINSLVAPMIETPYAMKKFVNAIDFVFTEEEIKHIQFFINIETITGFNNLNDIMTSDEFSKLNGIVLGRKDMSGSLGLTREDINSNRIFNIAYIMSEKMMNQNKEFVVGGGVSAQSIPFFEKLPYLTRFETRKVIFDAKKALIEASAVEEGISKALEFEVMWIKNKQNFYGTISKEDEDRIDILESSMKS